MIDSQLVDKIGKLDSSIDRELLHALGESARGLLVADLSSIAEAARKPSVDREMWKTYASLDWLGLVVPERLGGSGAGLTAAAVVAQSMGYAGRSDPYVAAGVITPLWLSAVTEHTAATALLNRVMAGGTVVVPAWQSVRGELDLDTGDLPTLVGDSAAAVLDGAVHWVPTHEADHYLVVAVAPDGLELVVVAADSAGVVRRPLQMGDGTTWAHLRFDAVEVRACDRFRLGSVERRALERGVDAGVLTSAAELLGLINRAFEATVSYLREREQFGRPIGTYQVLQHKAVDMWVQRELACAALADAHAQTHGAPDHARLPTLASSAKARAGQAALFVGNQAIQLHGAIGFTEEYGLGHLVNRSLVLSAWLGNNRVHRQRFRNLVRAAEPIDTGIS
ncbi:acyl-CoA dehydrogenase family protein [Streptomyces sp. NPDC048430]|uniref:acyl-CoA dehydrogenase family protein n=1 Tax=Streptomyces sp. NPDC048430 TaxID=3155388 RepID=UPI00343DC45E